MHLHSKICNNTLTLQILLQAKLIVAVNDGSLLYLSKQIFGLCTFAANGRFIFHLVMGVIDLHYINYPDSAGMALVFNNTLCITLLFR
ncbi:MAG: hypothetical protein R2829_11800 [Bacteroidia bacterium]